MGPGTAQIMLTTAGPGPHRHAPSYYQGCDTLVCLQEKGARMMEQIIVLGYSAPTSMHQNLHIAYHAAVSFLE